jgi:hypothetical protein
VGIRLLLETTRQGFAAAARKLATDRATWTWASAMPTLDPGVQRVELSVGDATCALSAAEVADMIAVFTRAA